METIRPVKVVSSKGLIFRVEVLLEGVALILALFKPLDDGRFDLSSLSSLIVSVPVSLLSGLILAWTWKSIQFGLSVWQASLVRETTSVWTCASLTCVGRIACILVSALFDFNVVCNKFHACSFKNFKSLIYQFKTNFKNSSMFSPNLLYTSTLVLFPPKPFLLIPSPVSKLDTRI